MKKTIILTLTTLIILSTHQSTQAQYSGGKGTPDDPCQISTTDDWLTLINSPQDWDNHFILTADLDFAGANLTPIAPDTSTSTGFQGTPFTGVFDGAGFVIRNAVINKPTRDYVGLFGCLHLDSQIRNLGVKDMKISGKLYTGGLVGMIYDGAITSCYTTGEVSGYQVVGGLVGKKRYGSITSSYATGAVTGNADIGGLVGSNIYGTITSCYATGEVIGQYYVGGLVGSNVDKSSITASFWDLETTGLRVSSGGKGLTTEQMKTMSFFQNAGWAGKGWIMQDSLDYPRLVWEGALGVPIPAAQPIPLKGCGTENDPYQIETAADFTLLSRYVSILDKNIKLMNDINLSGVLLYPIGDLGIFSGDFNGNGNIISNATINLPKSDYIGIFSYLGLGGRIRNLGVENVDITGQQYIGGLVGWKDDGTIIACYATGAVRGDNTVGGLVGFNFGAIISCYTTCAVTGNGNVGGLVGWDHYGTITSCYTIGAVTGDHEIGGLVGNDNFGAITSCYATGAVAGYRNVGGLMGGNWGAITSCYATGAVTGVENVGGLVGWDQGGLIKSSYATGGVAGNKKVGGLVGKESFGAITFCYTTGAVVGDESIGGLAGYSNGTITSCYATGAVAGNRSIGGLAGYCNGTITSCYAAGAVKGGENVGGLVGSAGATIISCYATGTVTKKGYGPIIYVRIGGLVGSAYGSIITSCYATGAVFGDGRYIGGLVGDNYLTTITFCYAAGSVEGYGNVGGLIGRNYLEKIFCCYATGAVTGDEVVGGLIGENSSGKITCCYSTGKPVGSSEVGGMCGLTKGNYEDTGNFWDTATSQTTYSAMGTGKTTSQMKTQITFTAANWDFVGQDLNETSNTWRMCADDVDYPRLNWEYKIKGDFLCPNGTGLLDLAYLSYWWLTIPANPFETADTNGDQKVNLLDYAQLAAHWLH